MRMIKEILRLSLGKGLGVREVGRVLNISPTTVSEYIGRWEKTGERIAEIEDKTDSEIYAILYPEKKAAMQKHPLPELSGLAVELKKKGVTRQLLWEEYRREQPDGYSYSQFCQRLSDYMKTLSPVMRFEHKAGEKMFVDFSGDRPYYINKEAGEAVYTELFVAVLGASSYTFAVVVPDQKRSSWIEGHIRAFEYFGGVPEAVVPDNLKSGVKTACRYDPEINPAYAELAAHYDIAVMPARPNKPKDKAKAESGVLMVQRWVVAYLRNRQFFSIWELNEGIQEALKLLNNRPMKNTGKSRYELFIETDHRALKPLPAERFTMRDWKKAKVGIDYHISVEGIFYSVPYKLIGEETEIRLSQKTVEIFHDGIRVTSHPRTYRRGAYNTTEAHRPNGHAVHASWTPERITRWAEGIGENTKTLIERVIRSHGHPEHAFRKCIGILSLGKKYGKERLDAACQKALAIDAIRYQSIKSILEKRLDLAGSTPPGQALPPVIHENIRGDVYYGEGRLL